MDYSKTKTPRLGKKGPAFRDKNALGGRNNPFGAAKPKPVIKPVTGKASKPQDVVDEPAK